MQNTMQRTPQLKTKKINSSIRKQAKELNGHLSKDDYVKVQ